ncbi:hypothetical protein G6F17_004032 [Rhizopus arrhizus]|nr:hypothetical protein G6F17_004032 [Rhizopus arrhizus]
MNPLSKRQFSKAINDYKASIRVIIQDSNTPRNIKKKLDWQIKELKVKPHVNNVPRHTPDASTIFHDDEYACINLDDYTYDDENKYEIDEVNVGKLFKKYQLEAAKQIKSKGCFLEADIQELLAINNILLIKPGQTSRLVSGVFSEACILSIQREIKQIFDIMDSTEVQTDVKIRIEKILKVGIRNLLEIIPKYKFNGLVKESQVGCSLIR